ncbi:hypothetical protein [Mucilaginibacter antarcticus]
MTKLYKYVFGIILLSAISYGGYAQNLRSNQQRKLQQKNFAAPAATKVTRQQNLGLSKIQVVKEAF